MGKKRGFTFIEIVFVLLLIGVLASVVIMNVTGVSKSAKEKNVIRSVDQLYQAAVGWSTTQVPVTYTGISVTALKTAEFLPSGFAGANSYGGTYTVAADAADPSSKVVITATKVPASSGENLKKIFTEKANAVNYDSSTETFTVTF